MSEGHIRAAVLGMSSLLYSINSIGLLRSHQLFHTPDDLLKISWERL